MLLEAPGGLDDRQARAIHPGTALVTCGRPGWHSQAGGDGRSSFRDVPLVVSFRGRRGLPSPCPWHQGAGWRAVSWTLVFRWSVDGEGLASSSINEWELLVYFKVLVGDS